MISDIHVGLDNSIEDSAKLLVMGICGSGRAILSQELLDKMKEHDVKVVILGEEVTTFEKAKELLESSMQYKMISVGDLDTERLKLSPETTQRGKKGRKRDRFKSYNECIPRHRR